jgi:two-component system, cell cycle response regulator
MNGLVSISPKWQAVIADQATASEDALPTLQTPARDPARRATGEACLVSIYPAGPETGTRYALADDPVVIGRNHDCAIRNGDASVSRCHALILRGPDGQYRVSDLGSTNGTFVNNASRQGGVLRDGDYLRVGNCLYRFLAGGNVEAAYREEIYRLTVLDGLTQVHNRRYLNEFMEREVIRSARHNRPLALVLLDIDNFKSVNDEMGYLAGDLALRELCARVRTVVRPDELLARYGGEEFAVVLPEAAAGAAGAAAERIRQIVAAKPFAFNGRSYPLTVSAGVSVTAGGAQSTVADLLRVADANLFQAKRAGRNRVVA